ncbi:MAG TPA: ABC transporter substrate-binding protein [bacterium]|nr:ABC transporter substrate-binding protein [bacterium]
MTDARRGMTRRRFFQVAGASTAAVAGGLWRTERRTVTAAPNVTLNFWNGLTGPDGRVMEGLVNDFMSANRNVKIEQQQMAWTDFHTKMLTAVPAGQGPDVAIMHTYEVPRYVEVGAVTEFTDADLKTLDLQQKDFNPKAWEGGIHKGKRYSVPLDIHCMCMYINNPMFKAAGLWDGNKPKVPGTMEEYLAAAKTLTKGDQYGTGWLQRGAPWAYQMFLWQNGGDLFDAAGEPTLNSPAALEVAQFLQDLNKKYHYTAEGITSTADAFRTGKFGMVIHGDWNIPAFVSAKMDFTVAHAPRLFKTRAVWAGSHQFYLPAQRRPDETKRQAAIGFIKWISDHSLAWTQGGHIPARTALAKTPGFQSRKQAILVEDTPVWRFMPAAPKILVEESTLPVALEKIFLGNATPKEALEAVNAEIKRARV